MTRQQYSRVVIPIAAIVYVIIGLIAHRDFVWAIGALCVGAIAVIGRLFDPA